MQNYFSITDNLGLLPREIRNLDNLTELLEAARMAFKTNVDTDNIYGWKEDATELSSTQQSKELEVAVRFTIAKLIARLAYNMRDESIEEMTHGPRSYSYNGESEDVFKHVRRFVDTPAVYYLP